MSMSTDELIAFFKSKHCESSKNTNNEEITDVWKQYREKLSEKELSEYISESNRLQELEYKEMSDSPYGIPNGRGGIDVFRPLRHKYAAARNILMGNFNLLSPEKAESWYNVHQNKYFELTGEYFDLSTIIERKF